MLQNNYSKAPSLSLIQAHLQSHGFDNIFHLTISLDLHARKAEFSITIKHDPRERKYGISTATDEDPSDFNQFLKLLEVAELAETILESFQSLTGRSKSIVFEHNDYFRESEHFKILADAIMRKILKGFVAKSISLTYYQLNQQLNSTN